MTTQPIPPLSFGLNLGSFQVSTQANADGLTTMQSDGLHIESGLPFFTGYYATNFNSADGLTAIEHVGPASPQTLTTAELDNIHLVAGEKLVIDYDYIPYDYRYDDFAFSLLKDPGGAIIPVLMGDLDGYLVNNTYPTHFQVTYSIGSTGAFDLMFGSSDTGDTLEPSDLIVHSVSIQAPPGGYTLGAGGVTLADGTVLQANGSEILPGGVAEPSLLSGTGSNLVSTLSADVASNLIGEDGSSLIGEDGSSLIGEDGSSIISQDGNGVISNDGGSVISNDGGSVITNDGGSVVSNDGGSIISQDGNGIISQDGNGLISQDGNGIINENGSGVIGKNSSGLLSENGGGIVGGNEYQTLSLDEAGGLTRSYTNALPTPTPGPAVPGSEFLISPAAAIGTSLYDGQTYYYQGSAQIAALSTGKFAVSWGVTQDTTPDNKPIGVDVQLMNADGTPSGALVSIASGQTATELDDVGTVSSIAALAGGGYAVTYAEQKFQLTVVNGAYPQTYGVYTQIFDPTGIAQGGPSLVASLSSGLQNLASAALSDGSFVTLIETTFGYDGSEQTSPFVAQRVGANGADIGAPVPIGPSSGEGSYNPGSALGLPNGAFAAAYSSYPAYGDTTYPKGIVYQVVNADGTQGAPVSIAANGVSPSMALLTNGNVVIAWQESDGVHAQLLTPSGTKIGGEISGSSTGGLYDTGDDYPPAVTALADGRFLIAYDTPVLGPLGNIVGSTVQAQLYNADGSPSGGVFAGAPTPTAFATDYNAPAAAQLTNGTVEIAADYQAGGFSSDIRAEPVSVTQAGPTVTPTGQATQQGRAVDGYISGATVFADANGNGLPDAGEATATTDALGRYTFTTPASGTVILTGGTDTSTGLPFTETLTAPAGALTVTPLTTLVQKIEAANGGNLQLAERQVNAEFGISASTDVTALDPVRAANAGFADGADAFVDGAIVADTVALAIAAGATGDVYGTLAQQIAANPASFDVTSVAAMQALGLTGTVAADTSALAQASKALLTQTQNADTASAQALLLTGAKIEKVAQGATSQALNVAVATQTFAPVLAAYTGASLANAVAGTPTPTPPSGGGGPTLTGGGATATTDTVLGGDSVIRSIPFGTAALATLAAPLLAATAPSTLLAIDAGGSYAMSGTNTAAVDDASDPVTLVGNAAAQETIAAGAGAFAFQGGGGSGTVIGGAGADSVYLPGGGDWMVSLGNGADTVVAATGNEDVATGNAGSFVFLGSGASSVASSGADTILGATGSSTVSALGAASDELFALGGPLVFIAGTGASTVVSGAVTATLFGGAGGGTLMFGDGPTQYVGAGGTDTVVGLAGSMTAQGGAGGGLYFGGSQGNNVITAGSGNVTAFGAGAGDVLTATGSANDLFAGGVGAETLTGAGSTGNNTFFAGFGPETLVGGGGNTALVASAGPDLLTGGSGLTLFLFVNGQTFGGADTISGFDPSHDFVKLAGYTGDETATAANASAVNGSSVITLSDGTSVTFAGVTQLNAGSFT